MKLSTRSTYGLRALAVLACKYGQGPVLLRDIVEIQHLPTTYLEQLMVLLRKSGLVTATRGVNGGYRLTRDPREVTLAEVVQILEGPINLVECSAIVNCDRQPEHCALRHILNGASQVLTDYLSSITLAELCEQQRAINERLGLATAIV